MSADWSAVPAPVPYANLSNPQTLNLYAMVSDNPETFADLDGHSYTAPTGGNGMDLTGAVTNLGGELRAVMANWKSASNTSRPPRKTRPNSRANRSRPR